MVEEVTVVVDGMHCGSCSGLIDDELADLAGVLSQHTSVADGVSVVRFDPAVVSAERIVAFIESIGEFTARLKA